ncbi:MAG: hypothetical protein U1F30_16480 [Steroidobacteraceae bacterium]
MRRPIAAFAGLVVATLAAAGPRADDLRFVRQEYVLRSPAFTPAARRAVLRFIDASAAAADAMTPEQYLACALRIAAFADNGHDGLGVGDASWYPEARLPLRMIWFADGWIVARADAARAELLGARVLAIEGRSPAALFRRVRDLSGGTDAYRRWNLQPLLENAGILHALGLAARPDGLRLALRLADGRRVERYVPFVAKSVLPGGQAPQRLWSPAPWPGEAERGWVAYGHQPVPLYLEEGGQAFRIARLAEADALYVQMRTHGDAPDETVEQFRGRVDAAIAADHPRNLVVDLRFDSGGDIDLTRDWQRSLAARIPGRIYVLIGPYTFSAGIVAAAALRHDAGGRARVVGEGPGDRLRWWSEGESVCMPASGYCMHRTAGLWDLRRGCAGQPACYGDRYAARVGTLRPDLRAPLTGDAWLAGRDPAMEAVGRDIGSSRSAR